MEKHSDMEQEICSEFGAEFSNMEDYPPFRKGCIEGLRYSLDRLMTGTISEIRPEFTHYIREKCIRENFNEKEIEIFNHAFPIGMEILVSRLFENINRMKK